MTTLAKLAEQYIHEVTGGQPNNDDQYDERVVAEHIRHLLNEMLRNQIIQNFGYDDTVVPGTFKVSYHGLKILTEPDTGRKYTGIPEFFVGLPFNKGLARVFYTQLPYEDFYERRTPGVTVGLHKMPLTVRQPYIHEGMRIYFDRPDIDKKYKEVSIVLCVAAPEKYGMNDVLPLTSEMASMVIALLKERTTPEMPRDQLSDNRSINAVP